MLFLYRLSNANYYVIMITSTGSIYTLLIVTVYCKRTVLCLYSLCNIIINNKEILG